MVVGFKGGYKKFINKLVYKVLDIREILSLVR